MAGVSSIEWTEATWNPIAGCLMVSPGCTNCYAMRMAGRLEAIGLAKYRGTTRRSGGRSVWTGQVTLDDAALSIPAQWRKPKRIFVNSMSDLFQDGVPIEFVGKVWHATENANWHATPRILSYFQITSLSGPQPARQLAPAIRRREWPDARVGSTFQGRVLPLYRFSQTMLCAIIFHDLEWNFMENATSKFDFR